MALTALALCSRALLKLGAAPIASFEEGTAEAEVAANLYPSTRDALLSVHPWGFATGQVRLPRLAASPVADYGHAFQLPADFLRGISTGGVPYRIAERRLHASTDEIVLTYIFRPAEADFPPFFDQALIARLAAEFCTPITESTARAQLLFKLADDEMRRARLIDTQQETAQALDRFPLVEARG